MRFSSRLVGVVLSLAAMPALVGCDGSSPAASRSPADDVTAVLTQRAAGQLDSSRRFVLAAPDPTRRPQITGDRAIELAGSALRTYGPNNLPYLEKRHGGPVNLSRLEPDSRVYYATSPYQELPAPARSELVRRLGPFYLVSFVNERGEPVVSVAVPAFATDAAVRQDGRLDGSYSSFFMTGVSRSWGLALPISPEDAAWVAARTTGALVAEAPRLVLRGPGYKPQLAMWRVRLASPVTVRDESGATRKAAEVFVGMRGSVLIPTASQPAEATILASTRPGDWVRIPRRQDTPVEFAPAVLVPGR